MLMSLAAIVMGAKVLEKHITLDRSWKGPDYEVSLEPDEFKEMVTKIGDLIVAMGSYEKKILDSELSYYNIVRRSIVAKETINKDSILSYDSLSYKRPNLGLQPSNYLRFIGKKTKRAMAKNEVIKLDDVYDD
jgi:N,N'-diacetyllegionaminate synthase